MVDGTAKAKTKPFHEWVIQNQMLSRPGSPARPVLACWGGVSSSSTSLANIRCSGIAGKLLVTGPSLLSRATLGIVRLREIKSKTSKSKTLGHPAGFLSIPFTENQIHSLSAIEDHHPVAVAQEYDLFTGRMDAKLSNGIDGITVLVVGPGF